MYTLWHCLYKCAHSKLSSSHPICSYGPLRSNGKDKWGEINSANVFLEVHSLLIS